MTSTGSSAIPPESSPLRIVALLLVFDLAVGLWLKLNNPEGLSVYYLVNAPTIGLTSFLWRVVPKAFQERVGSQVGTALESRRFQTFVLVTGLGLGLGSLFFSSVGITLADAGTTTTIHIVRGTQGAPDSASLARADTFRLDRLTSPRSTVLRIPPTGQQVWVYTPTHVAFRDSRLWPWLPARLVYPSDFVPLSQVAVLPSDAVMSRVNQHNLTLVLRAGDTREELASVPLELTGARVGFFRTAPPGTADLDRWRALVDPDHAAAHDSAAAAHVDFVVSLWARNEWARTTRPLRQGDTLSWEVRTPDSLITSGRLPLDAPTEDLVLRF